MNTTELLFIVEDDPDGGFSAHEMRHGIFVQGQTLDEIKRAVRDAVDCHFDNGATRPSVIRLHYVHDEVFVA